MSQHEADKKTAPIRVEFREARSNDLIIVRHMDAEELPESFVAPTEIALGPSTWRVQRAEPQRAEQFRHTRQLTLWLDRQPAKEPDATRQESDSEGVLFAPTSQHRRPALGAPLSARQVDALDLLVLYEEDWLQNEFLPVVARESVKKELGLIARTPMGMTHRLSQLPGSAPLTSLDEVLEAIEGAMFEGVALFGSGETRLVERGVAFESERGTLFYGLIDAQEQLLTLAIHVWEDEESLLHDLKRLASQFGERAESLLFVSWESQSVITLSELAR